MVKMITPDEASKEWAEFQAFAIECGVPGAVFWKDAVHCTCFNVDLEEDSPGVVLGMWMMWKTMSSLTK